MKSPIIYVFLNKDLHMTVGKASAQASHAVTMSAIELFDTETKKTWKNSPHRTIIVLEGRDEEHLRNIREYLLERSIDTVQIIDEGVNEIEPHTVTALATGILDKEDLNVIDSLSTFSLYRDLVNVNIGFEK